MSKFTDNVQQNTPRLVVTYDGSTGREQFQWGMVGDIPPLSLVGAIARIQNELLDNAGEECPESAFVMAWNKESKTFDWYIHSSIPLESLSGMLELIKQFLTTALMTRMAAGGGAILGPDGRPMIR